MNFMQRNPGDVILQRGMLKFSLRHFPGWLVQSSIRKAQKKAGFADPSATHCLFFLGGLKPYHIHATDALPTVIEWTRHSKYSIHDLLTYKDWCLSVTWPRATFVRVATLDPASVIGAYRLQSKAFSYPPDAFDLFVKASLLLLNRRYDPLQLFNFILCEQLGFPRSKWERFLDMGRLNHVCSTGCAYVNEYARQVLKETYGYWPWKRPFELAPGSNEFATIESIYPADYNNGTSYVKVDKEVDQ